MNLAWILEGIHNMKNSTPVQTSMDTLYSLVRTSDDDTRGSSKRKRRTGDDGYECVYQSDDVEVTQASKHTRMEN